MEINRAIRNRLHGVRGHLVLLLGLPATVMTIAAMTVAPAGAATGPAGKPSAPAHATAHQPGKPLRRAAGANDSCLLELGGLTPSATTVPVGTTVTLTATTDCDITLTPYYLQIFDVTTGTFVNGTGIGTVAKGMPTQTVATTQGYVAYLAADGGSTSFPPTGVYEKSATIYVTWEAPPNNYTVTLTGPAEVGYGQGPATYTATVNLNVGASPYYIELFDETTGKWLRVPCLSGTTCSAQFTPSFDGDNLVAFVSYEDTALPPAGTQASSNVLNTFQEPPLQ